MRGLERRYGAGGGSQAWRGEGMQEKSVTVEEATSSITGETAVNGVIEKNRKGNVLSLL